MLAKSLCAIFVAWVMSSSTCFIFGIIFLTYLHLVSEYAGSTSIMLGYKPICDGLTAIGLCLVLLVAYVGTTISISDVIVPMNV